MYALEVIRALEREAGETARLARAIEADALALKRRIHAAHCTEPECIEGWVIRYAAENTDDLAIVPCPFA